MKQPVLSICIPTYNRSEYLVRTIESIVRDPLFGEGEVELVVSDNASTDNTEEVVRRYCASFGNIVYRKNSVNIEDRNFPTAIVSANGLFRKLYNDTAVFLPGGLRILLDTVKSNLDSRPVLFFPNGNARSGKKTVVCASCDRFVRTVSYWTTWIAAFGIWKDDLDGIGDIFAGTELKLWQTKVVYECLSRKGRAVVVNAPVVEMLLLKNKSGYNIFRIFAGNYLTIVDSFRASGCVSDGAFAYAKRDLFLRFLVPWYFNTKIKSSVNFDISGMKSILCEHYSPFHVVLLRVLALLYPFTVIPKKCMKMLAPGRKGGECR